VHAYVSHLSLIRTAAYGHFGRTDIDLPWEQLNKVDDLRRAV
jgi:S-adenosylmethionine synthetase